MTDPDGVAALRKEFADEFRRRIDELSAAAGAGDTDGVLRGAHRLKGAAAALALPGLVAAMEQLEAAYRSQPVCVEDGRAALAAARAAAGGSGADEAVARLSHALRTPLGVVLGFAHLLQGAELGPEERGYAEAIVLAAGQMAVLIDAATGASAAAPASTAAVASTAARDAPVTVLYVEDDPASARLAEEVLRRLPAVRLVVATSGADGIAAVEREQPDLVLLDPGLPDMSGSDVVRRLRANLGPATPVVVVTGDSRPAGLQELLDAGASSWLAKPVDLGSLLGLVDAVQGG